MNARRSYWRPLRLLGATSLLWLLLIASTGAAGPARAQQGEFQQVAKLLATDGAAFDEFGHDVEIDGDFAIVGSPYDDDLGGSSGAVYIFERGAGGPGGWGQVAKLTAPNGGTEDFFGWRAAISGDTALVGVPRSGVDTPGSAFLFERDPESGTWNFVTELTMGEPGDNFGVAVALQADTAVVGASGTDGPDFKDGALFVYRRDAGGPGAWGQVAKLTAAVACGDSATACGSRSDADLPSSQGLDVDGDLILGSSGSNPDYAYVFQRARTEPEIWRRLARPTPLDFSDGDQFGAASVIEGQTLLVGAFLDDDLGVNSGSAYIFERDPGGPLPWSEAVKLTAPDGDRYDWFGFSVEMSGDLAVVGASQETLAEATGYAWVFERDAGGPDQWGPVAKLTPEDGTGGEDFGFAVAISGETVIVGATDEDTFGLRSGAAYVFERVPGAASEAEGVPGLDVAGGPSSGRRAMDAGQPPAARRPAALESGGPICFQLFAPAVPYCDDLELSVSGGQVTGWWRNPLCEGADAPISGVVQPGRALVRCDAELDPCPLGSTYGFVIDRPLDGTLDMLRLEGGLWNAWVDEIRYETVEGPCP